MKGNVCLYLSMYFILKIEINVKNCRHNFFFLTYSFQSFIFHLILYLEISNLVWLAVCDIHIEGTVSQNVVLGLSFFILCQKTGKFF